MSNPEYFDDDAFDVGSPLMSETVQTGNGALPVNRRASDRLGSGGSKDYYNSLDDDSAVGGMMASQPAAGRDRLSSRV